MIVLIGFMGSGKTTVGRMVAARLGLPYVDTDALIARRSGMSVAEIFASRGEDHFRNLEAEVVAETLTGREAVVSLGGGAVTTETTRTLLSSHRTVFLDVGLEVAMERARRDPTERPLLNSGDVARLYERRRALYRSTGHHAIAVDGLAPHEVAARVVAQLGLELGEAEGGVRTITVRVGERAYPVWVGAGIAGEIGFRLRARPGDKAFVVTHPSLAELSSGVADSLRAGGHEVVTLEIPEGEPSKSLARATVLFDALAGTPAHRNDMVITFGGGVVSDVGGFVASTYMRGLPLVHVPTTLLGQVDAAIGGKTGVNLGGGKNLVGTIYQPNAVCCDVDLLRTCPAEEIRSGLAEVLKYGFIADPGLIDLVVARRDDILSFDPDVLGEIVARSVAVKASVVATDEREAGDRAFLNYGHTWAHAIESVEGFGHVRHGEAVALGMMAAAYVAAELGRIDEGVVELHRSALAAVGLPFSGRFDHPRLSAAWRQDKKFADRPRFVLLKALGCPEAGVPVEDEVLRAALGRLAREDGAR